ncbi:hypothetical protein [Aquimarina sp. 2201CG5-10]|uniref:hypothetical protein n=1 Tax=Aquimarina callyspongiae TaxID=3098150 RepID=UPI002AB5527F|nr:hypothetical protein [Aquimarina sp. 2201CG5-10]MDY8137089.1 hypothetical protein [Aquimarina sp. 2201CG5-10]
MINNILNLEGVVKLEKSEQQSIKAGIDFLGSSCWALCDGTCVGGYCYQNLH